MKIYMYSQCQLPLSQQTVFFPSKAQYSVPIAATLTSFPESSPFKVQYFQPIIPLSQVIHLSNISSLFYIFSISLP